MGSLKDGQGGIRGYNDGIIPVGVWVSPWVQLGVWGFSFGLGYWGVSYCTCGPGYNNMGPHGYNCQLANMIGTGTQYAVTPRVKDLWK